MVDYVPSSFSNDGSFIYSRHVWCLGSVIGTSPRIVLTEGGAVCLRAILY